MVICCVLRNRIVQSSPGELPSYLAPSVTQRSTIAIFSLGKRVLLERHPRLAVEPDQLDQATLVGLARLKGDPLALLAPLRKLGERRHDVLALRLAWVMTGDAVLDHDGAMSCMKLTGLPGLG